ncbi:MAG: hypothetical protein ACKO5F_10815 [Synechococcus sp.]
MGDARANLARFSEGDSPDNSRFQGTRSPMESHSGYRGGNWSPERLMFHQNLESFAERVGLIVGLQSNGKISQEDAYAEIRRIWNDLRDSKKNLLQNQDP